MKHGNEKRNLIKSKSMGQRLISLVLSLIMCCQLIPVVASAATSAFSDVKAEWSYQEVNAQLASISSMRDTIAGYVDTILQNAQSYTASTATDIQTAAAGAISTAKTSLVAAKENYIRLWADLCVMLPGSLTANASWTDIKNALNSSDDFALTDKVSEFASYTSLSEIGADCTAAKAAIEEIGDLLVGSGKDYAMLTNARKYMGWLTDNNAAGHLAEALAEYKKAETAVYQSGTTVSNNVMSARYATWASAARTYYLLCAKALEQTVANCNAAAPAQISKYMPRYESARFTHAITVNMNDWTAVASKASPTTLETKTNDTLAVIISTLKVLEPAVRNKSAEAASPFSESKVSLYASSTVITTDGNGVTKEIATRNYLRLQIAQMQAWADVSSKAGALMEEALGSATDVGGRFDLKMSAIDALALESQMTLWLEDARLQYNDYDQTIRLADITEADAADETATYTSLLTSDAYKSTIIDYNAEYKREKVRIASETALALKEKYDSANDDLPALKNTMDNAASETNLAQTAADEALAKYDASTSRLQQLFSAYNNNPSDEKKAAYDAERATNSTLAGEAAAAASNLTAKKRAYQDAKLAYESKAAEAESLKKEWEAQDKVAKEYQDYEDVSRFFGNTVDSTNYSGMNAVSLASSISNYANTANSDLQELKALKASLTDLLSGSTVPSAGGAYNSDLMTKIIRYQELIAEVKQARQSEARARQALVLISEPNTVKDAEYRVETALRALQFAARDMHEFEWFEYRIVDEMAKATGGSGFASYWKNAAVAVRNNYNLLNPDNRTTDVAKSQFNALPVSTYKFVYDTWKSAQSEADTSRNLLTAAELRSEKTLSESELTERKNALETDYNTAANDFNKDINKTANDGTYNIFETKYQTVASSSNISDGVSAFLTADNFSAAKNVVAGNMVAGNSAILDLLAVYNGNTYLDRYTDYRKTEAKYLLAQEGRKQIAERSDAMKDQYALQVNTGSTAGTDKILYLAVVYEDTDGFTRKEYIFPNLDGYEKTMEQARKTLNTDTGIVNQSHINTMAELGQVTANLQQAADVANRAELAPFSMDYYLFDTQYEMAKRSQDENANRKFLCFEAFAENVERTGKGDKKNEWALDGMRLYKVSDFYGLSTYGYGGSIAGQTILEFEGENVASFDYHKKTDNNLAWSVDYHYFFADTAVTNYPTAGEFTFERDKSYYKTDKVGDGSVGGNLVLKADEDSEYLFKLDFADLYGAGIESLINFVANTAPANKTKIKDMGLAECLTLQLVYEDVTGARREVKLPVVTSSLAWAADHGVNRNDAILAYAQQDESLVFSAYLPEMETIKECYLTFGLVDNWGDTSGASQTAKDSINIRKASIPKDAEILLKGLQVYAPGTYTASAKVEDRVIVPEVTGKAGTVFPKYSMAAATTDGVLVTYGTEYPLKKANEDQPLLKDGEVRAPTRNYNGYYMLQITTDSTAKEKDKEDLAGTKGRPVVEIGYTTASGKQQTIDSLSIKEKSKDFYGYWPGLDLRVGAGVYQYLNIMEDRITGPGGVAKILFEVPDDSTINNIKITLPEDTEDDWQISNIELLRIKDIGPRVGIWEYNTPITKLDGEFVTDRSYDRVIKVAAGEPWSYNEDGNQEKILIRPGETKVVTMDVETTTIDTEPDVDWSKIRYEMDELTAMGDLGFKRERESYRVAVRVAGEDSSNLKDGDCGSINNFYFQLVFSSGESGYILGNQQLSGDGFRTGYIETLTIKTNRNYGELRAVRIIPDDVSEDSNIYDKLNIESITVSRQGDDAVNRTWVVDKVGWIGLDYHDEGEENSVMGRAGRSESEVARSYSVNYATHSIKLGFMIGTGQVNADADVITSMKQRYPDKAAEIEKALGWTGQFQGEVSMRLHYRNTQGMEETAIYDMVSAMYTYAGKKEKKSESIDATGEVVYGSKAMSDPNYMFRPAHHDYFELEIEDLSQLTRVDIIATGAGNQTVFWKIEDLNVFLISKGGTLNINTNNEYQKTYETEWLCKVVDQQVPFLMWCPAQNSEAIGFSFTANEVLVGDSPEDYEIVTQRIPDTEEDELNVYVYTHNSITPNTKLYCEAVYTTNHDRVYKSAKREMTYVGNLNNDLHWNCYAAYGIAASDISLLNKVNLSLSNLQDYTTTLEHIVVQRLREGVVISTYTMDVGGISLLGQGSYAPDRAARDPTNIVNSRQVVTLGFTDDTDTARLIAEERDIAVALRYTSKNDDANNGYVYRSPYIYLTDQQINTITSGGTVELTFREKYLNEVKEVLVFATGGLKAAIDRASVAIYAENTITGNDVELQRTGWYDIAPSTPTSLEPGNEAKLVPVSSAGGKNATANPMRVTFVTANVPNALPNGPIKMTVKYKNVLNGGEEQKVIEDIRNNLIQGSLSSAGTETADRTAVIRVMLKDVGELQSIKLECGAKDTWVIDSMGLEYDKKTDIQRHGPYGRVTLGNNSTSFTYNMAQAVSEALTVGYSTGTQKTTPTNIRGGDVIPVYPYTTLMLYGNANSTLAVEKWDSGTSNWVNVTETAVIPIDDDKTWQLMSGDDGSKYRLTFSAAGQQQQIVCTVNVSVGDRMPN